MNDFGTFSGRGVNQVKTASANRRPTKRSSSPVPHLDLLQEINEFINHSGDLKTILEGIVSKISETLRFEVVSIYVWDPGYGRLVLSASKGLSTDIRQPVSLAENEGLTGLTFTTRQAVHANPASDYPNYKFIPGIGEELYENYYGIPLLLQNRCLGVFIVQTLPRKLITPAQKKLLQIVSSRLSGLLDVTDRMERLNLIGPEQGRKTTTFQGLPVSRGFAVGKAFIYSGLFQETPVDSERFFDYEWENQRLKTAFHRSEQELADLIDTLEKEATLSESEINIFRAHLEMLKDPSLRQAILKRVRDQKQTAEFALSEEMESLARQFENRAELYLKDRALDFRDLGHKLLHALRDPDSTSPLPMHLPENTIVVASQISPSLLVTLFKNRAAAIVTEKGGKTSHTAILAQALGIPAVSEIDDLCARVRIGENLLVDGNTGFVITNPGESLVTEYENNYRNSEDLQLSVEAKERDLPEPLVPLELSANIGFPTDIELARKYEITDVGLFRTEFTYMQYSSWPSLEEQVRIYEDLGREFPGTITVRTLDIGADKTLPYLELPHEENPLLGLRAIRFFMEHLEEFLRQMQAILLAHNASPRFEILLPMITSYWEVQTAREKLMELGEELDIPPERLPRLGMMVEVPAAFVQLEDFMELVDFVSVGTNDLVQYLLSVDRDSGTVSHLFTEFHPAVFRALRSIRDTTTAFDKPVMVCGELSGNPLGALALMALGFRRFSISPVKTPLIRYLSKKIDPETLPEIEHEIFRRKNGADIRNYLEIILGKRDPVFLEFD